MLGNFFKYLFLSNFLLIYNLNVKQFGSQMKPHILWGFIWIQIVCNGHQPSSKFTASGLRVKEQTKFENNIHFKFSKLFMIRQNTLNHFLTHDHMTSFSFNDKILMDTNKLKDNIWILNVSFLTLSSPLAVNLEDRWWPMQTIWIQMKPHKMWGFIWDPNCLTFRLYISKKNGWKQWIFLNFERNKYLKKLPSMQRVKHRWWSLQTIWIQMRPHKMWGLIWDLNCLTFRL